MKNSKKINQNCWNKTITAVKWNRKKFQQNQGGNIVKNTNILFEKKNNKINRKESKGITLIALVITVVLNAVAWS